MKKSSLIILISLVFTLAIIILGYIMLGTLPMLLFTSGFLGGFILWLIVPTNASFDTIRVPYFLTLGLFVLHKIEERKMDFFPRLSEITGVPLPETDSPLVYLLYTLAGAWLLIPYLIKHHNSFGYYLAWTFFTSMGVIELAHFLFPFFIKGPYSYFPGMVSVIPLAPAAWWGLWRLSREVR